MPIYEYECDLCRQRFERLQRLNDPLLTACPKCGGAVHKQFSVPALQFKGSGFYITDYAHRSGGSVSSEKKPAPAKDAKASGGSKSD
jgi:putative FmdB family regulatory protein